MSKGLIRPKTQLTPTLAAVAGASLFALSFALASAAAAEDTGTSAVQSSKGDAGRAVTAKSAAASPQAQQAKAASSSDARARNLGGDAQQASQAPAEKTRAARAWKVPSLAKQASQAQAPADNVGAVTARTSRVAAAQMGQDQVPSKTQAASSPRFRAGGGGLPSKEDANSE